MGSALLEKPNSQLQTSGLDLLARSLTYGEQEVFATHGLVNLIEAALEQLENDDTFSPTVTDQIVDSLTDAIELYTEGQEPWHALDTMLNLYYQAREEKGLFEIWTDKAREFSTEDIRTELWDSFLFAASLVESGKGRYVTEWLDEKLAHFEASWNSYCNLHVSDSEITMESEMCHHFLQEGIESWIQALKALQEVADDYGNVAFIVEEAEWGQRQLVAVQTYEAEAALAESKYFVNFN